MSRKLVIDPITRIEGHGKVVINLDDDNKVVDARLHVVEFRGFEKFVQGHPYWEAPVLLQRICGICFVSHHLAGAKVLDDIIGAGAQPRCTASRRRPRRCAGSGTTPRCSSRMRRHTSTSSCPRCSSGWTRRPSSATSSASSRPTPPSSSGSSCCASGVRSC